MEQENRLGRKLGHAVIWVLAFGVSFVAVKEYKQWSAERGAVEKANAHIDEIRTDAVKNRPPSEAFRQEAVERSSKKLAAQSGSKQTETAADMFWGFLLVNTRELPLFCKEAGVDISPFVKALNRCTPK